MRGTDALVAIAERANPRRSFLLVSTVLGKHMPVRAERCRLAGTALGLRVARDARAAVAKQALATGDAKSCRQLLDDVVARPAALAPETVVLGFAETATALGEQVASTLDAAWFQTTTRQRSALADASPFEESHSHAPEQWIAVPQAGWPDGPIVIVDDELTTGATAARLIAVLHARQPRDRYVIAALVDGRPDGGDGPLEHCAQRLQTQIDVICLQRQGPVSAPAAGWSGGALPEPVPVNAARARKADRELLIGFSGPLQHHGQTRAGRHALTAAVGAAADEIGRLPPGSLALGTGEHLAFAQRCAHRATALTSSTTRSPVLVSKRTGYPIRDGLAFANPDADDLAGYAYNVRAAERPAIVVHFQDAAHRARGQDLLDVLHHAGAASITAVTLVG